MDPIISQIILWPGSWAPEGWFFCQGQTLAITQYQALFSLIGITYGGDGVSNFKLPNLQGLVVVGAGLSPISQKIYQVGTVAGVEQLILTANQTPLAAHTHPATANSIFSPTGSSSLTANLNVSNAQAANPTPASGNSIAAPNTGGRTPTQTNGFVSSAPNTQLANGSVTVTGGITGGSVVTSVSVNSNNPLAATAPVPIMQPYMVLNYLIAWTGIYPVRP